ncbi:uncharacterized protein MEPE_04620 [Melanopsichium pennsylvanicum]|uniref:Uncharacterized protein n=1 Tax=Melanopsichium pennsylvanicum TaxID=63383 RepID=A0AAJ4XQ52_9BASI|nr:uncharacterized protein MEPE_04620 [Melanopsichium pennsylvanicum]
MSIVQPKVNQDGTWHFFDGALKTYYVSCTSQTFTLGQIFCAGNAHSGIGQKSSATPPYHIHLYQTKTFDVKQGTLCYLIDGKQGTSSQKVNIPPYRPHTFWSDPQSGQDLDFHITVSGGPNPGFDEDFVHNFYSYLSLRVMQGKSANPFQMLRFLDDADVILVPTIPFLGFFKAVGLLWPIGRIINIVFGRILGGWVLGYPTRYKQFDDQLSK